MNIAENYLLLVVYERVKEINNNNRQKTLCNALQKKITLCFIINISNTYKLETN